MAGGRNAKNIKINISNHQKTLNLEYAFLNFFLAQSQMNFFYKCVQLYCVISQIFFLKTAFKKKIESCVSWQNSKSFHFTQVDGIIIINSDAVVCGKVHERK